MLLSMVATPDQKMTSTGPMFAQRLNVAASRARDRMVLVRSVELADLSTLDLKARLIEGASTKMLKSKSINSWAIAWRSAL